jgi:CheY-like chemotaxis protein
MHQRRRGETTVSILTVDDEADIAELFRQYSRRECGKALSAAFRGFGQEALQMLADGTRPQLIVILSDINMPGMDGHEVKKSRPEMPVMMVTAYGHDERRRWARELGAAEFVTKPVEFDLPKEQLRRLPTAADWTDPGLIASGRFLRSTDPPIRWVQGPEWASRRAPAPPAERRRSDRKGDRRLGARELAKCAGNGQSGLTHSRASIGQTSGPAVPQ